MTSTYGQSVVEKIALNACSHLDSVQNFDQLETSVKNSIAMSMAKIMQEGSLEERKQLMSTVENIRSLYTKSVEILPGLCYNVRRLMIEEKTNRFYRMSDNQLANDHYNSGNLLLESGDFKKAIKEFNAAIKLDKNFIYAIDNLAVSYRRQNDFKTATKYYEQSLEIFPEGNVALLNIAVAQLHLHNDDNALKYYEQLKFLYPNDPEGYFGTAKILLIRSEYENALDNLFSAHIRYVNMNSEYVKDSEQLIGALASKLKEIGRTDILDKKAKEYNIEIDMR